MLTENYIFDALEAERDGVEFPIEFDTVWQSYGFKTRDNARQYIRDNAENLIALGLMQDSSFKTGVNNQSVKSNKICLSVKGLKFTLARAKTVKGAEYLLYLLDVEESFLAGLERALLSEPNPEIEALKTRIDKLEIENKELKFKLGATVSDRLEFPYSSKQLKRDSQIVKHSQVVGAIKRDFQEGEHYQVVDGEIFITEQLYWCFMMSFRSKLGADISALPDVLFILTKFYFQFQAKRSKKNSRTAQSDKEYIQPELF